ncbi:MAG: hypothetical protein V8S31_02760 [Lachnospiraceae bacterium]
MYDYSSVLITIGGSLAGVLASHKLPDFIAGLKSFSLFFKDENLCGRSHLDNNPFIEYSKEGRTSCTGKKQPDGIEDECLKGVMLVVDGTDPELVRGILETDLDCIEART